MSAFLTRLRTPAVATVVFLLALIAYHWILPLDFTGLDSGPLIQANRFDQEGGPLRCFTQEVRASIEPEVAFYRPWTGLSYGFDHAFSGLRARAYHAADLMLHAAVATALVLVLMSLGTPGGISLLAGAWFAVHPLGVEVVPAVARRAELWVTLFLLLACLGWRGRQEGRGGMTALLVVAGLLAPLSKETGFVLPFLLASLAAPGRRWRAFALGLALVAPAMILRTWVLQGLGGYGGWTLQWSSLRSGLGDLLDPARLGGTWGVRIVLPLWILASLARALRADEEESRRHRFALAWIAFLLAPAALARGLSPWYLYAPAIGMAALLAALLSGSGPRWRARRIPVTAVVMASMLPALLVSPIHLEYPAWGEVSRQMRHWKRVVADLPPEFFDGPQLVAGLPFRVDDPARRFGRVRSASCLTDFSLRAWAQLLRGRDCDPHAAALARILRLYAVWGVQVSWRPSTGEVRLHGSGPVELMLYRDDPWFTRWPAAAGEIRLQDVRAPLWRYDGWRLLRVPIP